MWVDWDIDSAVHLRDWDVHPPVRYLSIVLLDIEHVVTDEPWILVVVPQVVRVDVRISSLFCGGVQVGVVASNVSLKLAELVVECLFLYLR
ncbi:MAG: hypothetical protein J07HQW2_00934 [Haloquadratum walsbyi J07HQW2]|uniref:Uncharacterized protein n=1 Tax=Haloquadratum walsbyi J07HQW2 TaxID=1238425 RepID=U1NC66_9EURY|nr:MAG: hypothetical protein J07HQW2_00934 [Haloquadratum walsbyi J07HQW2]